MKNKFELRVNFDIITYGDVSSTSEVETEFDNYEEAKKAYMAEVFKPFNKKYAFKNVRLIKNNDYRTAETTISDYFWHN